MKRDRFESDYERVRREAGLARRDFDEPGGPTLAERIEIAHENFKERMAEVDKVDTEQAARRSAEAAAHSARWNARIRLQEYHRAGVKPPKVDFDGNPEHSLPLMLSLGWRVARVGDQNVLVAPGQSAHQMRKREDYDGGST